MLNFNDADPQRGGDLITDGTVAKVVMTFRSGGSPGPAPEDATLLKASNQPGSDVMMLDCEFIVAEGPAAGRKFWQNLTVAGGKRNDKGESIGWNITKSTLRAMIESAYGIKPDDISQQAVAYRSPPSFSALHGLTFVAVIGVGASTDPQYPDKNKLAHVVTPDEEDWARVNAGETVPLRPSKRSSTGAKKPESPAQAAWQSGTAEPAPQAVGQTAWQQPAPQPQPAPTVVAAPWNPPQAPQQPAQQPQAPQQPAPQQPAAGPAWLNS